MLLRVLPFIFLFVPIFCKPHQLEVSKELNDGSSLRGRLDLKNLHRGPEVEVRKDFELDENTRGSVRGNVQPWNSGKTSAEVTVHKNLNDQTSLSGNYHNREGAQVEVRTSLDDRTSLAARAHSNRGTEIEISKKFDNGDGSISLSQGENGARVQFGVKLSW